MKKWAGYGLCLIGACVLKAGLGARPVYLELPLLWGAAVGTMEGIRAGGLLGLASVPLCGWTAAVGGVLGGAFRRLGLRQSFFAYALSAFTALLMTETARVAYHWHQGGVHWQVLLGLSLSELGWTMAWSWSIFFFIYLVRRRNLKTLKNPWG